MKPFYAVIEGPDYSGKTSILDGVVEKLRQRKVDHLRIREPGTTEAGVGIRNLLQNPKLGFRFSPKAQTLMMYADRVETQAVIKEQLEVHKRPVISDRCYLSSIMYQGVLLGELDLCLNLQSSLNIKKPDLIFIITVPVEIGLLRAKKRIGGLDVLDEVAINNYTTLNNAYKNVNTIISGNYYFIDGSRLVSESVDEIISIMDAYYA
ncbi:thymidylate kinase [Proteus phage 10]|nr:thymidylate kinase [Proteus phage 10]